MKKQKISVLVVLLLVMLACNMPAQQNTTGPQSTGHQLVTADPNAAPTPTPFQPSGALPTQEEAAIEVTGTPAGTDANSAATARKRPDGQISILVLGSDYRPSSGYRTDVILLISINTKEGTVTALSFPRDLYVDIPGRGLDRINTAQAAGGFALTSAMFQTNFGFTPDHYIMTNFQGFIGIIDHLGGIDVNAAQTLSDHCDLPQRSSDGYCTINSGVNHMDGKTALWYVRSRYSSNDFDRTRRAQEVLLALFQRLMSMDAVTRAPELWSIYRSSVETDLEITDIVPLLPIATQLVSDSSRIRRYNITPKEATGFVTSGGAQVLQPNYELIQQILDQAIYTP